MRLMQTIIYGAVFIIGIGVLLYLADYGISARIVPSFSEYVASTTEPYTEWGSATTTDEVQMEESVPILDGVQASSTRSTTLLPFYAPKGVIQVSVAKTPGARDRGLSGRATLAANEGMLFIFPEVGEYAFWMKDMNFPIDIVWIASNKKVVGISENIAPETYPETVGPGELIQFVLEVPAGSAQKFGLKEGSTVAF